MSFKRWSVWMAAILMIVTVFAPLGLVRVSAQETLQEAVTTSQTTASDVTTLLGDIDGNGAVDTFDSLRLYGYTSGALLLSIAQQRRADIHPDGVVDMRDAVTLYRVVSGVTTTVTTSSTYPSTTAPTTAATAVKGIDVSYAQGVISWQEVVETEVSFAILRCGYGDDEPGQQDTRWDENAAACEELGIPYGAYFFCYARNAEEAAREAAHALRLLQGKNLTLPVFLDMEYSNWQGDLTPSQYAEIATVFCETVGAAGYKVGVYSNLDWWNNRLTDPCFDRWYRWVAQYNDECEYQGTFHLWQYADNGAVDGIDHPVDMNECYVDLSLLR